MMFSFERFREFTVTEVLPKFGRRYVEVQFAANSEQETALFIERGQVALIPREGGCRVMKYAHLFREIPREPKVGDRVFAIWTQRGRDGLLHITRWVFVEDYDVARKKQQQIDEEGVR